MSETPRKSLPVPPPAIGSLPPEDATKAAQPPTPKTAAEHVRESSVSSAGATGSERPAEGGAEHGGSMPSVGPPPSGRRRKQPQDAADAADAKAPPSLVAGTLVGGRYEVGDQFGEGGVGLVYRAKDRKLGRDVAVKIMREELSDHSALRPRFEQEAGALVALVHPNIVTINDYGLVGESPYIVMELLSGQTLRQELDRGPMAEKRAFDIALQLLHGLSYAHAQGVAHRDLKPSNIFLQTFPTQPDVVKILDFGFVAFLHDKDGEENDLAEQDMGFGTPSYMPPEQIRGEIARPESDVYAVGLLLFEMLCGHKAYDGELKDIVRGQLNQPLPRLAEKQPRLHESEELLSLLSRATAKDPDARFGDAGAMLRDLERIARPATWTEATGGQAPLPEGAEDEDVTHRVELPRDLPTTATGATQAPGKGKAMWIAAAVVIAAGGGYAMSGGDAASGSAEPTVAAATAEPKAEAVAAPVAKAEPLAEAQAEPGAAAEPSLPASDAAVGIVAEPEATAETVAADGVDAWLPQGLTGHLEDIGAKLAAADVDGDVVKAARLQVTQHPDDVKRMLLLGRVFMARGRDVEALDWYRRAFLKDEGVAADPITRAHLLEMAYAGSDRQHAFRLAVRMYGKDGVAAVDEALKDTALRPPHRATLQRLRTMMAAQP